MSEANPTSWAAEVVTDSSGKFAGNGLRFATAEEAQVYVEDLRRRWWLVTETRVVESTDAVNYTIVDGEAVSLRSVLKHTDDLP